MDSAHSGLFGWFAVEFDDATGEYAISVLPRARSNSLPSRSRAAATCVLANAERALMGRFGLPRTLHMRRVAWTLENRNGTHEQFDLPPAWTEMSHDEALNAMEEALAAAHAEDAALRDCDVLLSLVFVARGLPATLGRGWLLPRSVPLPEPPKERPPLQWKLTFDEEFDC
mmetsp:Transcript_14579/g.40073  ORF Transcript_14579/g.40073 Transcript_14579/m.40073 type:complete len:171 (-) Transcript_14579:268-780(-)|eukprot:CAMPEP_0194540416 /NCGR_PEP_ID=MMETSP0253-20130528/80617_1 /TAXON_ID=2966 /ORGANISM="Noctiluca scintillans" /LENGTH=170 /DNA_ID=CAMNT_0039386785 /DNA_START=120 /DNA_END=632 /DNA_ORIENTATION=+